VQLAEADGGVPLTE